MWKAELVSDGLEYLAEEISNENLEVLPGFFLLLIVKCERKEIN